LKCVRVVVNVSVLECIVNVACVVHVSAPYLYIYMCMYTYT